MEKLTERDEHGDIYVKNHDYIAVAHKLARYEDLAEQGMLIELPVPLGTTVYMRYMDCEKPYKPENCTDWKTDNNQSCESCPHRVPIPIKTEFWYDLIPLWNKTVFKTKKMARLAELEEAE